MSAPFHRGLRRASALLGAALMLSTGVLRAASFGENRDFSAAKKSFEDGLWSYAETRFAEFVERHPKSDRLAEAVLYQARAGYHQGKHPEVIALLAARQADAGRLADRYLYWMGEAHLANTNYAAAAAAFGRVVREFPGSARRLSASVREATARARLGDWPGVTGVLQAPDGVFQQAAQTNAADETVLRGRLLLAEAGLARNDFRMAEAALKPMETQPLPPELNWQRRHLLCRVRLAAGETNDALRVSEELITVAQTTGRRDLLAESIAVNGEILERLGRLDDAIAAYGRNLKPETPVGQQQQALLKITELRVSQSRVPEAMETLEQFLRQSTNALALLTLGELHLKQHLHPMGTNAAPLATNQLSTARRLFEQLAGVFPGHPLVGKAELNRGWCFWLEGNLPDSLAAFAAAAGQLSSSEDLAVARFKLADAQFALNDFAGALKNYRNALEAAAGWPRAKAELTPQALYQILRAALNVTNVAAATEAMQQLLQSYPDSAVADRSVLLVGQAFADLNEPARARAEFTRFVELFPESPLRPEVELAIAGAYEQQGEWGGALTNYDNWLDRFTNSDLRPRAEFNRAWANFQAGNETNALRLFTNFVAQFATDMNLAPQAQWWVADHYYGRGDFPNAEKNYKLVFQNWPGSELAYHARMMAGRAAVGSLDYRGAIDHFTNLTSDLKCPAELRTQALFAYGGALISAPEPLGTNRQANLDLARSVFNQIIQSNPTNENAALAWGEIGNCYLQLAAQDESYYTNALHAYQQVTRSAHAGVLARSQAQVGLAATLEARARRAAGDEQKMLLRQALGNYLDVLYEKNLRAGETRDLFWVKKAGLEAARLAESMQEWTQAVNLYRRLGDLPLKESLERRIQNAQKHVLSGGN